MTFVVLPDRESASSIPVAANLPRKPAVLNHESGRPWIIGSWHPAELLIAHLPHIRIVVLGPTTTTVDELVSRAARIRQITDVDALARTLTGSFHLIACVDGHTRVQGALSNARRFFHTTIDGVPIAADRPRILARLRGSSIDHDDLALHLLTPFGAPWPLSDDVPWHGVHAVVAGDELTLPPHGAAAARRWWHAPEPDATLDVGAHRVAAALEDAVAARSIGDHPVCADLSGGMDSTTLAFLVAESASPLVTVHNEPLSATNDDTYWADRCRQDLPEATHVVIRRGTGPVLYAGIGDDDADVDGPSPFMRARSHYSHLAATVAKAGARYHLSGVGGDELFQPTALCLGELARTEPLKALGHLRRFRHRYRWTVRDLASIVAPPPRYDRWLASLSFRLDAVRDWGERPEIDWEIAPRMPPWATAAAADAVRRRLRLAAVRHPRPLADRPVDHSILRLMQINGLGIRMQNRIAENHGVSMEAPYADDRVIEAALSIRYADRLADGRPKSVLARAMRHRVPHVFDRATKGDASAELYAGIRRHRADLERFCDESLLADEGLIDRDVLRRTLTGLHADTRPLMPFDATLGLELWLRSTREFSR